MEKSKTQILIEQLNLKNMNMLVLLVFFSLLCLSVLQGIKILKSILITESNFRLVQLGDFARYQYLYEPKSGRIWKMVCTETDDDGDCVSTGWVKMKVEGIQ